MKKIIIALDGPAGSGKTTTAKRVADELGYLYIDTGAMYRAVTHAWIESNKPESDIDEEHMEDFIKNLTIHLKQSDEGQKTLLNGKDVSYEIRLPEVTRLVSPVSAVACVRGWLVDEQRHLGENGGVVMDGRDIGTVVFPQAELKIYLIASPEARAHRRYLEMKAKGMEANEEEIKDAIIARDEYDSTRDHSPLRKADDAIEIDTSDLSFDEQTKMVIELAKKAMRDSK
jgi:cytidylate kinase